MTRYKVPRKIKILQQITFLLTFLSIELKTTFPLMALWGIDSNHLKNNRFVSNVILYRARVPKGLKIVIAYSYVRGWRFVCIWIGHLVGTSLKGRIDITNSENPH